MGGQVRDFQDANRVVYSFMGIVPQVFTSKQLEFLIHFSVYF